MSTLAGWLMEGPAIRQDEWEAARAADVPWTGRSAHFRWEMDVLREGDERCPQTDMTRAWVCGRLAGHTDRCVPFTVQLVEEERLVVRSVGLA